MTIYLGYSTAGRQRIVEQYCSDHAVTKTVVIAPDIFPLPVVGADHVRYADVIMYVTFYRLLQKIDGSTLVVLNECLRTQNRYDLAYNCIRNYLTRTPHVLVFQTLPQIDEQDDFMVLFDWATQSRWKRRQFDSGLIADSAEVHVQPWPLSFERIDVPTSAAAKRRYASERKQRFAELGARDPHTLPRNLYLIGGKDKLAHLTAGQDDPLLDGAAALPRLIVARNQRLGNGRIVSYDNVTAGSGPYLILEFPHRFIDFIDFLTLTGQAASTVLVADLKVDHWYFDRYTAWKERIDATYASLRS